MGRVNKGSESYIRRSSDAKKALNDVAKNLESVLNAIGNISEEQLKEVGLSILNKSNEYAPMDTGELIDSSYSETYRDGDIVGVEIGYKDQKAPYVHEIGPYKNPTIPGTDYKFLQRSATEIESDIPTIIADAIKNNLR